MRVPLRPVQRVPSNVKVSLGDPRLCTPMFEIRDLPYGPTPIPSYIYKGSAAYISGIHAYAHQCLKFEICRTALPPSPLIGVRGGEARPNGLYGFPRGRVRAYVHVCVR